MSVGTKGGLPEPPNLMNNVVRLLGAMLVVCALYGCGGGGFLPGGAHSMNSLALQRLINTNAAQYRVPANLVNAMIVVESHGDPSAVSRTGAAGLMQLMPDTAAQYGVANRFNPDENVSGGCRYLHDLMSRYHNNISLVLAAYNAGPGAVDASRGVPRFPETRAYVARVNAALRNQN